MVVAGCRVEEGRACGVVVVFVDVATVDAEFARVVGEVVAAEHGRVVGMLEALIAVSGPVAYMIVTFEWAVASEQLELVVGDIGIENIERPAVGSDVAQVAFLEDYTLKYVVRTRSHWEPSVED